MQHVRFRSSAPQPATAVAFDPLAGRGQPAGADRARAGLGAVAGAAAPRRLLAGRQGAAAVLSAGGPAAQPHVHLPLGEPDGLALFRRRRRARLQRPRPERAPGPARGRAVPGAVRGLRAAREDAPAKGHEGCHESIDRPVAPHRRRERNVLLRGRPQRLGAGLAQALARQGAGRGAAGLHAPKSRRSCKACAAAGTSIVPQGGNTGLVVGSMPDASRHAGAC